MRRIFRPRNLFLAALLAVIGTAIVAWRRRQSEETAWSEIESTETAGVATISRLDTPQGATSDMEAAQTREAAATLHAAASGTVAESVASAEAADLHAALDLDTTEASSITPE